MTQNNNEYYLIHYIDNNFNTLIDGVEYFMNLITFNIDNKFTYDKYLYVFD